MFAVGLTRPTASARFGAIRFAIAPYVYCFLSIGWTHGVMIADLLMAVAHLGYDRARSIRRIAGRFGAAGERHRGLRFLHGVKQPSGAGVARMERSDIRELHPRYGRPEQSQRFSERRRLAAGLVVSARGTRALRSQRSAGPAGGARLEARRGRFLFRPPRNRGVERR